MAAFVESQPKRLERCESPNPKHEESGDRRPVQLCTNFECRKAGGRTVVWARLLSMLFEDKEQPLRKGDPKTTPQAKEFT